MELVMVGVPQAIAPGSGNPKPSHYDIRAG
jgi:hypothetical protein